MTQPRKFSKKYASVNVEMCVACGACSSVCPRGAADVWRGCYAHIDVELCVGCGKCAKECPANAITLKEREAL